MVLEQSFANPVSPIVDRRGNVISQFFEKLTRPHPSVVDIETRRQSRLLAALTLTLFMTTTLADILLTAQDQSRFSIITPLHVGQIFTLCIFFLNRSGRYRLSAYQFVIQNFLLVHLGAIGLNDLSWLMFTSMMLILSALLLPVTITLSLFVVSVVLQIFLGATAPSHLTISNVGLLILFFINASLILVFMSHRFGLERERQLELQDANTKLRASELALKQINASLEQKVKDRTLELEVAKDEAERANLVKSAFLASMSHELRTPLNAIINFTKFVAKGFMGPVTAEQVNALDQVSDSGKHLLNLINDVLDMSKIEAGSLVLFVEDNVDLSGILSTIESTGKSLLDSKPVTLISETDKDLPLIRADRQRVLQILLNIMSNACKFTDAGEIRVKARRDADHVVVSIKDSGSGIAPEDQALIFEAFKQTEAGLRQGGGTGLGMPISKNLVEAHGGHLWLESDRGKGATFFVSLPIKSETLVPFMINEEPVH